MSPHIHLKKIALNLKKIYEKYWQASTRMQITVTSNFLSFLLYHIVHILEKDKQYRVAYN